MTPRTILAATDFSPASEHAVARATALARDTGATLELLHVVPSGWLAELRAWLAGAESGADTSLEAIKARLEADAFRLAANCTPSPATHLAVGTPAEEIGARAREIGAGLVVVGAHGRHYVREALLGTTALAAASGAALPVLVVRRPTIAPYLRIVVGTDLSAPSMHALRLAAALAPQASIELLHAYEDPYAASLFLGQAKPPVVEHYRTLARSRAAAVLDDLVRGLGPLADRVTPRLEYGPASLRVLEGVSAPGVDLTVAGVRRRGPLERAALGSVSTHIVLESPTDVLIVPDATETTSG